MESLPYIVGGSVVFISVTFLIRKKLISKPAPVWPEDTVILHQLSRGPHAPSVSPFPIKLETFLRMARIPYQNDLGTKMSSKGKTPWITYNGVDVADSQFCIEYLKDKLVINLNKHLSAEEVAIARAFQKLVEEDLYWHVLLRRWVHSQDHSIIKKAFKVPSLVMWVIRRSLNNQARGQGLGRHSESELWPLFKKDIEALSVFLGKKKFLMGDEPSEVDCCLFGMLAQIKWQMWDSPHEKFLKEEATNLSEYCDRMKEVFWPDWDKCITHGFTVEAEK